MSAGVSRKLQATNLGIENIYCKCYRHHKFFSCTNEQCYTVAKHQHKLPYKMKQNLKLKGE